MTEWRDITDEGEVPDWMQAQALRLLLDQPALLVDIVDAFCLMRTVEMVRGNTHQELLEALLAKRDEMTANLREAAAVEQNDARDVVLQAAIRWLESTK